MKLHHPIAPSFHHWWACKGSCSQTPGNQSRTSWCFFHHHHHHLLLTCWSGQNRSIFSHLLKSSPHPSDFLLLLHSFFAGRGNSLVKPLDTRIVACSFPGSQIALKLPSEWQFLSSILLKHVFYTYTEKMLISIYSQILALKKKISLKVNTVRAPQHTSLFYVGKSVGCSYTHNIIGLKS